MIPEQYSLDKLIEELHLVEVDLWETKQALEEARNAVDNLGNEAQRLTIRRRALLDLRAKIDGNVSD